MKNEGLSIHCHHEILMEYCTDYKGRVAYIKSDKPKYEQKIRLRLFKLLPKKALKDLPQNILKADADRKKADADWNKADADWKKAYADWPLEARNSFHKKWCGCKEWNGKEIVFK